MFNLTQPYKLTALPWVFNAQTFQFMLMQVTLMRVSNDYYDDGDFNECYDDQTYEDNYGYAS